MIYSVVHEKNSNPSKPGYSDGTMTFVASAEYPKMDKVIALLAKFYGDDVDKNSIRISVRKDMTEESDGVHNLD